MRAWSRRSFVGLLTSAVVVALVAALDTSPAIALPKEREPAANARVEDADGRALDLASLKGKPYVIIYDDKTSAPKSEPFRLELVKKLKESGALAKIKLLPVADVSELNFWPVKGIVLDAVRDATKKVGAKVYCDWTGGMRSTYKFKAEVTSIVLVDADGRVTLAREGVPAGAEKQKLLDAINKAAGVGAP